MRLCLFTKFQKILPSCFSNNLIFYAPNSKILSFFQKICCKFLSKKCRNFLNLPCKLHISVTIKKWMIKPLKCIFNRCLIVDIIFSSGCRPLRVRRRSRSVGPRRPACAGCSSRCGGCRRPESVSLG